MKMNTPSNISNSQSLRVLIVEDSEDDALLEIRELKKGGYNPVYERVETAAAMKKALKEKQWDIILCDYKMPQFSGKQAIALLKETNIDIPLIIVSGTVGEETAIECMRSGAHDYVMKDSLSRLCPAIARELEEAKVRNKQRQAENALRQSEEKYRTILDEMADVYFEVDLAGNFTFFNDAIFYHVGYSREELIGTSFRYRVAKEDIANLYNVFGKIYSTDKPERSIFYKFMHKDGTMVSMEAAVFPLHNKRGEIVGFRGISRDITERKRAEEALRESERKYKSLIDNFQDIILTINLEGKITFASKSIKEKLGYESAETINMSILDFVPEEDHQKVLETLQKGMKGEKIKGFKTQVITKSGERLFFESSVSSVYKDGAVVGAQTIIKDITEQKQAEDELRKSEENFRLSLDDSPLGVRIVSTEGETIYANQVVLDIYGYDSMEEINKIPIKERYTPQSYADYKIRKEKREWGELGPPEYEISIVRKNGEVRHLRAFRKEILWDGVKKAQIIYQDITERKRVENNLRQSEEKYRTILENIEDGYYEVDIKGNFTFFNDSMCRILGYPEEEMMGMNNRQFTDKENANKLFKTFNEVYRTGESTKEFDWQIIRKDGTKRYIEVSVSLQKNSSGQPIGFQGIARDITERKKMEETLRQSEERYRTILDEMADAYFEVDVAGNYTFVNDAVCHHLGYTREELIGTSFRNQMVKEELEKVYKAFSNIYTTGKPQRNIFYKMIRKDGTTGFAEMTGFPLKNQQGEVIGFRGVGQDVTERKRAEDERKQSFERLRKALGATVQSISTIVEMKDPYTAGHQQRVSDLARSIAIEMGLSADQRDFIRTASAIHDIGKISIPAEILSKPTKLTDLEFNLIKTHSQSGYDILKDIEFPWPVADVVLQHHERMDGSGYPQGLKGNDILLEARIMAVADVVEAIASHRPYRPSLGIDFALDDITRNKGILYDADVVDACLKLFQEKSYTLLVLKN
jgi:PAS domain S-box-containing protein